MRKRSLCTAAMENWKIGCEKRLGEGDEIKSAKEKILGGEATSVPLIKDLASHVEGSAGF